MNFDNEEEYIDEYNIHTDEPEEIHECTICFDYLNSENSSIIRCSNFYSLILSI